MILSTFDAHNQRVAVQLKTYETPGFDAVNFTPGTGGPCGTRCICFVHMCLSWASKFGVATFAYPFVRLGKYLASVELCGNILARSIRQRRQTLVLERSVRRARAQDGQSLLVNTHAYHTIRFFLSTLMLK